jgi:hypothetical protein
MGAGAVSGTAHEFVRAKREMDRHLYGRYVRRQLHRIKLEQNLMDPNLKPVPVEDRAGFPCFHLCSGCGFMDRNAQGVCPACGKMAWYDLADEHLANTLRDQEEKLRLRSPGWVKLVLALLFLAAVGIVSVSTWGNPIAIALAAVVSIVAYPLLLRPFTVPMLRLSRGRPRRWRMPMPLPEKRAALRKTLKGKAQVRGDLLTAPFSRRKCIAYQVSVLFDTPADARPPQWVVMETWGTSFHINGTSIDGDNILVKAPLQPVQLDDQDETGPDLVKFLRERGLFAYDGEFSLFEALVKQEDEIEIKLYEGTQTASVSVA